VNPDFFFVEDWPVFYLDNHLLVLYKPAGLLVQSDETGDISCSNWARNGSSAASTNPAKSFSEWSTAWTGPWPESFSLPKLEGGGSSERAVSGPE